MTKQVWQPLHYRSAEVTNKMSPITKQIIQLTQQLWNPTLQTTTVMKALPYILIIALAFAAGYFYHKSTPMATPQQLTLEQILSIKELHLVKHTYNDLFFLHKKNNINKPVRAIVQVPVTITAYLNLKEIQLVRANDSIKTIVLPHARLNEPNYQVDRMIIRETRSLQVHIGKDLYPLVGDYLKTRIAERIDTLRKAAITNRILLQAETEGKEYVESLLGAVNRKDIKVTFDQPATVSKSKVQKKITLSYIR